MPQGKERDKEVADWKKLSVDAMNLSKYLSDEANALAYVKIGTQKISRMMNNSFDNFAVVEAEYGYMCKDLMDTPQKRWNYWMQKEIQAEKQLNSKPK